MPTKRIQLSLEEENVVRDILKKHLPEREVWVFGSRAGDHPKRYSDLDLLIQGETSLPAGALSALKEAFEESNLPFQVDVVEWATTSNSFREIIAANHLILQPSHRTE